MTRAELKRGGKKPPSIARKRHRNEFNKKAVLVAAAIIFLLSIILYGLYRPEVNIKAIEVNGTHVLRLADIEKAVENNISGKYFFLVPKRSAFFYPGGEIAALLKKEFKRIDTLNVARVGFTKLVINLSERPERYLWCGQDIIKERTPDDECYFIDSGGYIFSKAPYYSGNIFLEFYGPLSEGDNSNPAGGSSLSEDSFNKLMAFVNGLDHFNLIPVKILIKADGDYELSLPISGKILISGKNDLEKNIEYLKSTLGADPLKIKMENNRNTLDYLDLRFGNKVFFKFK